MNIIETPVKALKPYEKNAKQHSKKQIAAIAESIKLGGFVQPIVIDADNVIVIGHGRLQAAKKLKYKTVPCVKVDELTEEQIKALRLADNSVVSTEYDLDLLAGELAEIEEIDMSAFGFDLNDEIFSVDEANTEKTDEGYYGDARENTYNQYLLHEYDESRTAGKYQIPTLSPCKYIPKRLIGFNYMLSSKDKKCGIHFFIDDYQFQRIWNNPHDYIDKLNEYQCVLTPDFSLYLDMPMAMKIWNVYRSRLIGQIMQDNGINVILTLQWAEPETFDFCFDGLPQNSVVAISTVGVKRSKDGSKVWLEGAKEAVKRLQPSAIINYGGKMDYDYDGIKTVYIENEVTEAMKNGRQRCK